MRRVIIIGALLMVATACNSTDTGTRQIGPLGEGDSQVVSQDDSGVLASNASTGNACGTINATQACACGELSGRQVCGQNGRWGLCECLNLGTDGPNGGGVVASNDPPINKAPANFDWLRTEPGAGGGDCRPGHYEGSLDGVYNAPSAFTAPVPIVSVDVTGQPGFQIDLAKGGNGEFLTVTGGSLNGTALAIFPFEAEFADGMLDCATGLFRARIINGSYIVFFDGFYGGKVMYTFEGEIVARYDASTSSLVDGRWSVSEGSVAPPAITPDEPPPIFPPAQAGGTGTWTATWTRSL